MKTFCFFLYIAINTEYCIRRFGAVASVNQSTYESILSGGSSTKSRYYIYEWPSYIDDVWPAPESSLHAKSGYDHGFYANRGAGDAMFPEVGLFQTWQFSLYKNLMARLRTSEFRTKDPTKAVAFIIPFDLGNLHEFTMQNVYSSKSIARHVAAPDRNVHKLCDDFIHDVANIFFRCEMTSVTEDMKQISYSTDQALIDLYIQSKYYGTLCCMYVDSCYLCHVMLCDVTMLCHYMLCHVMICLSCHVWLCYVMLFQALSCYVMLCYVMLCYYVISYYIMLCYLYDMI